MHQDKTTIDISNESLEEEMNSFIYKHCHNKFSFKAGANWQKEKDKAIIDKLVQALKMATELLEENNNYPHSIKELRNLINHFQN